MRHVILTDNDWYALAAERNWTGTPMPGGKRWEVDGETVLHYDRIYAYVTGHPVLRRWQHVILADWSPLAEHLDWLCTAPPEAVADWARHVDM